MIGEFPDISQARENIHRQARLRWVPEWNAAVTRVEELEAILTRLGDDPFRLGRFEVICDLHQATAKLHTTNSNQAH